MATFNFFNRKSTLIEAGTLIVLHKRIKASSDLAVIEKGETIGIVDNAVAPESWGTFSTIFPAENSGVYAYMPTPADTTVVEEGVYYPISGSFENIVIENFSLIELPAIRYDGVLSRYFKIVWNAAVKVDHSGTTVHCGIKKNTELEAGSVMCTYCKTAGEIYHLSGTLVVELATNDTIQLVVTTDGDGDVVTFNHYTTSISKFFE